ncbi:regulator of telomere elongation helicase [Stylonychia lemnae]|uniref:Regulator of telomere elongation helicase n=1 Tax=Stylonychia lemnae TaxID=5949 RepID=A0A078AZV3_STYLE|nr:regulator of telomere elongation helicase [Stylonychia lemnae]|eukprot:CDW87764.1 regulator of telomere elongation helicase [Stylonychia lemnae]
MNLVKNGANLPYQHKLDIMDTKVHFPINQPYPQQVKYMHRVIEALTQNNGQNALLESPTGTGKTLSLLCACSSWLKEARERWFEENKEKLRHFDSYGQQISNEEYKAILMDQIPQKPKIIFASRTHSQLEQIYKEIDKLRYDLKTITIGSRDQFCINDEIDKNLDNSQFKSVMTYDILVANSRFYNKKYCLKSKNYKWNLQQERKKKEMQNMMIEYILKFMALLSKRTSMVKASEIKLMRKLEIQLVKLMKQL